MCTFCKLSVIQSLIYEHRILYELFKVSNSYWMRVHLNFYVQWQFWHWASSWLLFPLSKCDRSLSWSSCLHVCISGRFSNKWDSLFFSADRKHLFPFIPRPLAPVSFQIPNLKHVMPLTSPTVTSVPQQSFNSL